MENRTDLSVESAVEFPGGKLEVVNEWCGFVPETTARPA
jgi:hypothetical protein